eukprot:scaffold43349_cov15-Prasinocladus_malaysianus.AAC.1
MSWMSIIWRSKDVRTESSTCKQEDGERCVRGEGPDEMLATLDDACLSTVVELHEACRPP